MRVLKVLICLFVFIVAVNASAALPVRTWVSGLGDDAWPCSFTAPCKTFASAFNKTETGGMITVKDAGSFGGLTINRSMTIDGGGNFASLLYSVGDGITVNFTSNDGYGNNVVIRGLSFTSGYGGGYGIAVLGTVPTNLHVLDSTFTRTAVGVGMFPGAAGSSLRMDNVEMSQLSANGIIISPPAGTALKLSMDNVRVGQTGSGYPDGGMRILANTNGTIANSSFRNGQYGILIEASSVHVTIARTVLAENIGSGLHHQVSGITTLLDSCSIFSNGIGVSNVNGTVIGFSNNAIGYNGVDVAGTPMQSLMPK